MSPTSTSLKAADKAADEVKAKLKEGGFKISYITNKDFRDWVNGKTTGEKFDTGIRVVNLNLQDSLSVPQGAMGKVLGAYGNEFLINWITKKPDDTPFLSGVVDGKTFMERLGVFSKEELGELAKAFKIARRV